MTYQFDQQRIKPLISAFLQYGCDFDELPQGLKGKMRVYMHENIPSIWLCDGFNFIEAHFTKEAISEFRKNHSSTKFSQLRDKMMMLHKWRLVLKHEDSRQAFNSYQNLSVHIVVEQFRPLTFEKPPQNQISTSKSVFREPEIEHMVRNKRQEVLKEVLYLQGSKDSFAVPSAKDIFSTNSIYETLPLPERIENDQLMLDEGEENESKDIIQRREKEIEDINEHNNLIYSEISTLLSSQQVLTVPSESTDFDDFIEFKHLCEPKKVQDGDAVMIDTTALSARQIHYYDVKRLLIQEKGEDDYHFLYKTKRQRLLDAIKDDFQRNELTLDMNHYQNKLEKLKSRLDFKLLVQQQLLKQENKKKAKRGGAVRYRLGLNQNQIKEKVLRFMATFNNPNPEATEQILELREEFNDQNRERALSQEDNRNDQSELLETKSQFSHLPRGYALSQYICHPGASVFNDDGEVTESEHDDEENHQKMQTKFALSVINPNMELYKRYIQWFSKNEVSTQDKYSALLESIRLAKEVALQKLEAEKLERERRQRIEEELERQRQEQERLRQEHIEAEKQRKIERAILKQKQLEEERERALAESESLKQQKQIEEYERERVRLERIENERREREEKERIEEERLREQERLKEEEEQLKRIELEQEAEKQRLEQERLLREEQENARRAFERIALEQKKAADEERKRKHEEQIRAQKLQAQKEDFKRQIQRELEQQEERRKAKEFQKEQRRIAELEEQRLIQVKREEALAEKKRQEEEIQRAIEAAAKLEEERIQREEELRLAELHAKLQQERLDAEVRALAERKREEERLRQIEEERIREQERLRRAKEEQERLEMQKLAEEKKEREFQEAARLMREQEEIRILQEKQRRQRLAEEAETQKRAADDDMKRKQDYIRQMKEAQLQKRARELKERELETERQKAAALAQATLLQRPKDRYREDDERSSVESSDGDEATPAFQENPSDLELVQEEAQHQNDDLSQNSASTLGQAAQQSPQPAIYDYQPLQLSEQEQKSLTLQELLLNQKREQVVEYEETVHQSHFQIYTQREFPIEDEDEVDSDEEKTEDNIGKRKIREDDSKLQHYQTVQSKDENSEEEKNSDEEESNSSDNESSVNSDGSDSESPEGIMKTILSVTKMMNKCKDKTQKKCQKLVLEELMKKYANSKSAKKSSSLKKKDRNSSSSTRHTSQSEQKKDRPITAFQVNDNQQLRKQQTGNQDSSIKSLKNASPVKHQQSQSPQKSLPAPVQQSHHQILVPKPIHPPIVSPQAQTAFLSSTKKDIPMTSFDLWQDQQSSGKQNPISRLHQISNNSAPPVTQFNSENVPDNGQYKGGFNVVNGNHLSPRTLATSPATSTTHYSSDFIKKPSPNLQPSYNTTEARQSESKQTKSMIPSSEETIQQLKELQYLVDLGTKKRPKQK